MANVNKVIKYAILKGVGFDLQKAKECYDFINEEPVAMDEAKRRDGIYLIRHNGEAEPYTDGCSNESVRYIGVVHNGHSFALALNDITGVALLPVRKKAGERKRLDRECDAIYDFDSAKNTEALSKDNPALRDVLNEGEAIPALGVLNIIAHLRDEINEALTYIGGQELKDTWYWSSTEHSLNGSWGVNFSNGYATNGSKYFANALRAVAAF